jgi:hypothetical protein
MASLLGADAVDRLSSLVRQQIQEEDSWEEDEEEQSAEDEDDSEMLLLLLKEMLLTTIVPTWDQRDLSVAEAASARKQRVLLEDLMTEEEAAARAPPQDVHFEHRQWEDPHGDGKWMTPWHFRLPEADRALLRALRCADSDGTRAALAAGADPECVPDFELKRPPGVGQASTRQALFDRMARTPPRNWALTNEPLFEPPLSMAIAMCDWEDPQEGNEDIFSLLSATGIDTDRAGWPIEDSPIPSAVSAFRALPRAERCERVAGVIAAILDFDFEAAATATAVDVEALVNARHGTMALPALGRAVRMDNLPAARALLARGAALELANDPERPPPQHGKPIDDWPVRVAQPSFSALCLAETGDMADLLIERGADIGWSPVVATTTTMAAAAAESDEGDGDEEEAEEDGQATPQSDKMGTTPLLSALDRCGWYMGAKPVGGMEVIQALLFAGADIAQGGWRSRGAKGDDEDPLRLTWQTPHSWLKLFDEEDQCGFGPGTFKMIQKMFREHAKHRVALRTLRRAADLPEAIVEWIVNDHAGLAPKRRRRKAFVRAEEDWG